MELEIPKTFQAIDLWSDQEIIARQLADANGKKTIVSIVYPRGSREIFHEDGVYEIASLMKGNNSTPYIAEILNDDGTARRIGFSLEGLAGALVPSSNGDSLKLKEHPGRFRRVKIKGENSIPIRRILETQVGKLALISSRDNGRFSGKYLPTKVDEVIEESYRATVLTTNGANTGIYYCKDILGILVAEKNLPAEFIRRGYY